MKLRYALTIIPFAMLLACGGSDGEVFTLNTGSYKLSSAAGVGTDDCNLASAFPDGTLINVTVANGSATFSLGSTNAARNPVSVITDNSIAEGTKTYTSNEVVSTCTESITVTTSGELLADDEFSGTLKYSTGEPVAGSTGCTASALGYKVFPCASTMTFLAKKE
jgi:major membrane immunogen (membrane-anchored lipoprotein)